MLMLPPVTPPPLSGLITSDCTPLPVAEPIAAAMVTVELLADWPPLSVILNTGDTVPVDVEVMELFTMMLLAASSVSETVWAELKLKLGAIDELTVMLPVPPVLPLLVVMVTLSPASNAASIVPVSTVPTVV